MKIVNQTNKELKLAVFNQTDSVRTVPLRTTNISGGRTTSLSIGSGRFAVGVFIPKFIDEHVQTFENVTNSDTLTLKNGSSNGVFGHITHTAVSTATEIERAALSVSNDIANTANAVVRDLEQSGRDIEQAMSAVGGDIEQTWRDTERAGQALLKQVDFVSSLQTATTHLKRQTALFASIFEAANDIFAPGRFEREIEALLRSLQEQRFDKNVADFMRRIALRASVQAARQRASREGMGGTFYLGVTLDAGKTLNAIPIGLQGGVALGYLVKYSGNDISKILLLAGVSAGPLFGTDGVSVGFEFGFGAADYDTFDNAVAVGLGAAGATVDLNFTAVQGLPFSLVSSTQPRVTRFGSGAAIIATVSPGSAVEVPEFQASLSYAMSFTLHEADVSGGRFVKTAVDSLAGSPVKPNTFYTVRNFSSSQFIANNGARDFGTQLLQKARVGLGGQWQFIPVDKEFFQLRNRFSGMFIANFGSRDSGAVLRQTNNPGSGALWRIVPHNSGFFRLQNQHSGMFMANFRRQEELAPIVQVQRPGDDALWRFDPV